MDEKQELIPLTPYNKGILAFLYGFNSHRGFINHIYKNYPLVEAKFNEMDIEYNSRSLRRLSEDIVAIFFEYSYRPILNYRTQKIIDNV